MTLVFRSEYVDSSGMDPLRMIAEEKGVFLTQEALAFGYDEKAITRAVRGKLWRRVRRGAYVPFDVWAQADPERQHLIRAAAIHRSYGDKVAFSHVTACLLQGIDVWNVDLSRVHVTRTDGRTGRVERDVVHHELYANALDELDRVDGWLVVPPARAALQVGLLGDTEVALVSLDSVLHSGQADTDDLANLFEAMQQWPGKQHLHVALRMADGRAESVGESRCRWMFRCGGVPKPDLQLEVRDADGIHVGTTDFAWKEHRLLGEFDGFAKYGRLLRPGQRPEEVLFAEKLREDDLRRTTGYTMMRWIWPDLSRPELTCRRLRERLGRAA